MVTQKHKQSFSLSLCNEEGFQKKRPIVPHTKKKTLSWTCVHILPSVHLYGGRQLRNELSRKTMVQESSKYTHTLGKCPFPPVNVIMPLSSAQQIISNVDFQPHSLPGCLYISGSSVSCSPLMGCEGTACGLREGIYKRHKKLSNIQLCTQNMQIYI